MGWWAKLFGRKPKIPDAEQPVQKKSNLNTKLAYNLAGNNLSNEDLIYDLRVLFVAKESISTTIYEQHYARILPLLKEISVPTTPLILKDKTGQPFHYSAPGTLNFYRDKPDSISYCAKELYGYEVLYRDSIQVPPELVNKPSDSPEFLSWLNEHIKKETELQNIVISDEPIAQRAKEEKDKHCYRQANDYFTQAREPGIEAAKRTELLEQALQHCLQLSSNNDYYQNFKEMVFNLYLSGEEANIMEPLSEVVAGALTDSEKHADLSYAILQSQKHQHDALLERAHRADQEKSPIPPVAPVSSSAVTPVSISPADAQPSDKLDADEPKPPRADKM